MATKRWILLLLAAAMTAMISLAGCSSSTANVQNPPAPPSSQVTVTIQTSGSSVAVNGTISVTATVQGNSTQVAEGVTWLLTCQGGSGSACGTLSSPSSASGTPITYTAPATTTTNSFVAEIVAYSQADQPANAVAPITVSSFDGGLQAGNYVLQAIGSQSSTPYQFAAVITLDGQGDVTAGEQTINSNLVSVTDTITPTGSSYFLGNDGRGTITLNDPSAGTEIFSFVFLSNSQNPEALLSQNGIDNTGATATGTISLQQTSIATPSGSYAFLMNGYDVVDSLPVAFGGILDIPSSQTIISGVTDEIVGEKLRVTDAPFLAGSELSSSTPDTFGKITFTLVGLLSYGRAAPVTIDVTGYIVDASHIILIESDTASTSTITPFAATGGLAVGQPAGSYGNFNYASFSGTYVFGVTGVDLYEGNTIPTTWTSAGLFTADGTTNGLLSNGFTDTFLQLNCLQLTCTQDGITGAQISSSFTGTYSVDSSGTGRATLSGFTFNSALSPTYIPEFFFYLTGNGNQGPAALILGGGNLGPSPNQHYPSVGTGVAYLQSTEAPAFTGPYGLSATQVNSSGENDLTGQMTANPTATPQISGVADSTFGLASPLTGSFATAQAASPFAGDFFDATSLQNFGFPFTVGNNSNNGIAVDYYFIDPDHGFFVETDLINSVPPTTPQTPSGQVSLGYYTTLCPVSSLPAACPTSQQAAKHVAAKRGKVSPK